MEVAKKRACCAVLGSMTFGKQTDLDAARTIVNLFIEKERARLNQANETTKPVVEIDTAFMYEDGKSEEMIADVLNEKTPEDAEWIIATKANPFPFSGKSLSPSVLTSQFTTSLKRLQRERIDIFYLHAPDYKVPIEQTLEAAHKLYEQGLFKELGLSNYAAWQVVEIYHICKNNNWVLPTVYQGMYNPLTRSAELELFPALRRYSIKFYCFNPLAGGLLTGKYESFKNKPTEGRFVERKHYKDRFWKQSFFNAIDLVKEALDKENISSLTDATFRWMIHHSHLKTELGDRIILGGSTLEQFEENLTACYTAEPLPKPVVQAFQKAWNMTKPDCPLYFKDS